MRENVTPSLATDRKRLAWMPGAGRKPATPTLFLLMLGKIKPLLITAAIAVIAVVVYNKFIAPKFNLPAA